MLSFSKKILFIPLDSRPTCLQFNQISASFLEGELLIPPTEWLGNFSKPAECDSILDWMETLDVFKIDGCVISLDLLLYGGLVASRDSAVSLETAQKRLERLLKIRNRFKDKTFYVYSVIMRIAPTATLEQEAWYTPLYKYLMAYDESIATDSSISKETQKMGESIPSHILSNYSKARERNHFIQNLLLDQMNKESFDYLVLGQDDASPYGPHRLEIKKLQQKIKKLALTPNQVYYAQGSDCIGSLLLSKILLRSRGITPRIHVVCSNKDKLLSTGRYESRPLRQTIYDQIYLSGSEWVQPHEKSDYTLYINMPQPSFSSFQPFLDQFFKHLDKPFKIAFADIDIDYVNRDGLGATQFGNKEIFYEILKNGKIFNLLGYAAAGTPSSSIGTLVASSNLQWFALNKINHLNTQVNHYKWIFHRILDDYVFHIHTRQKGRAYAKEKGWSISLLKPDENIEMTALLNQDMTEYAQKIFNDSLQGKKFSFKNRSYKFLELKNLRLTLPWSRLFDKELNFNITYN